MNVCVTHGEYRDGLKWCPYCYAHTLSPAQLRDQIRTGLRLDSKTSYLVAFVDELEERDKGLVEQVHALMQAAS